jgi:hypothetical protein
LKPTVRDHDRNFLLKLFRAQQRINQIDQQHYGHKTKQKCLDHPCFSFAPNRSHAVVYPIAIAKNSTLAPKQPRSHILASCQKLVTDESITLQRVI